MSAARAPQPRSTEHAEAQRTRILDAAQKRFIEEGFHAASMASIADTAGMSAGLIYRYFESKEAIVLAIIERELACKRARIAELHAETDLLDGLVRAFGEMQGCCAPGRMSAALMLEMSAEATRRPAIAAALQAADDSTIGAFRAWLERPRAEGGRGMAPGDAEAGALLVKIVVEGLAVRAARDPGLDPERLRRALAPIVGALAPEATR